jgi:hypothetical protein
MDETRSLKPSSAIVFLVRGWTGKMMGNFEAIAFERCEYSLERITQIDVRRAMQCEQCVIDSFETELFLCWQTTRDCEVLLQRVDHHVAHKTNSFARDAFGDQVFISVVRRREE